MKDHDEVNHPSHYTNSKAICSQCEATIECIDVTRHMGFNLGNAMKYIWRHEMKNGRTDIEKAIWYLRDYLGYNTNPQQNTASIPSRPYMVWHNIEKLEPEVGLIMLGVHELKNNGYPYYGFYKGNSIIVMQGDEALITHWLRIPMFGGDI